MQALYVYPKETDFEGDECGREVETLLVAKGD
jgi:hypothetical protein